MGVGGMLFPYRARCHEVCRSSRAAIRSAGLPARGWGSIPALTATSLIQAPSAGLCMLQELRIASSRCVAALTLAVLSAVAQDRQRDPHLVDVVDGQFLGNPPKKFCEHNHVATSDVPCPARGWGLGPARGWVILPFQQSGLIGFGFHDVVDLFLPEVVFTPFFQRSLVEVASRLRLMHIPIKTYLFLFLFNYYPPPAAGPHHNIKAK